MGACYVYILDGNTIVTYFTLMKGLKVSSWPMVEGIVGRFFFL